MATTDAGYPYPVGTDPVRDGDDAIRALAEALGTRTITWLADNSMTPDMAPSTYPGSASVCALGTTQGQAWGLGGGGAVLTIRTPAGTQRAIQWVFRGGVASEVKLRSGASSWLPFVGGAAPWAEAAGQLNGPAVAAGETATFVVTFPSGRFTVPPILAAMRGHTRLSYGGFPSTPSSVTITAANYSGGGAGAGPCQWHAVQMTDTAAVMAVLAAGAIVPAVATCQTAGCENQGVPLDVDLGYIDEDGNTGQVDPAWVLCGVCGNSCAVELVSGE